MRVPISNKSISVLLVGCGNMGRAMLRGWIQNGINPRNIVVIGRSVSGTKPALELGCRAYHSPEEIPLHFRPNATILAVKPDLMPKVVPDYKPFIDDGSLLLSIAAGCRLSLFEQYAGPNAAVIRTMPNTPAAIGRGMMVSCANGRVTPEQRTICDILMSAIGETAWVDDEKQMDAVTGLSGSGPAYVFQMIEGLIKAGVEAGLTRELAEILAKNTVAGAGELALRSPETIEQLRINVTSPNGTTAAGLEVLRADKGLDDLMVRTVAAATLRSEELSK